MVHFSILISLISVHNHQPHQMALLTCLKMPNKQLRSQNIFNNNAASVETSSQARFNNINQNQAQRPVISPQQQFNSEQTVKSFRNFKFESLGSRFSSAQAPSDQFYFGPPSQTINMRDGSYTIITVLS